MTTIRTLFVSFFLTVCMSYAQEKTGGRLHGLIVGDYFYKTSGDTLPYGGSSQFSSPLPKDSSGFQIRRLHLFYDYVFSDEFSTRIQLEGNEKSLEPGGRQGLYVKTAYGEWKNLLPASSLLLGLVPTPTLSSVEGVWGYRSVEKTMTDFRSYGSGSDMGILLRGALPVSVPMKYALMIGNGNTQRPENNRSRKYYAMLGAAPAQGFTVETYVDYEPDVNDQDRTMWKAFLSYQTTSSMIGAEIFEQVRRSRGGSAADKAPFGLSLFSWYTISDQWKTFGRLDYYDPDRFSHGTDFYEFFISLGVDYMPANGVHFMPNIWLNTFTDKSSAGRKKDADVVPRLTFFFQFN